MVDHERCKALRSGRSRILQAWVRIPLLTFFPLSFYTVINCNQQSKITHLGECQDGRAVLGAAFRSQSVSPGLRSNPTSDIFPFPFTQ